MTHRDANRLARQIDDVIAVLNLIRTIAPQAARHCLDELGACDGFPERGESATVATSAGTSTTEAAMLQRDAGAHHLATVLDFAALVATPVRDYLHAAQKANGWRAPRDAKQPNTTKLCRDGIADRTRNGSIEWHDPTCMRTADRLGLCWAHYQARRRWLHAHGIDEPDAEDEPVPVGVIRSTIAVIVRDGVDGAAHVRAARTA